MIRRRFLSCLCVLFTLTGVASAQPPDLDRWVARAMQTFEVPGIGLAIVKDDAVVLAKGYGVRKLGDPAPVDARTLFGIASNTKVFTATALGLLVEEHKIEWDAPVVRYLPAFAMWDPVRHARADGPRPARPPQRPRPRRRRSALVAGVDLRPQGDRAAAPLHPAGHELPQRLRLRQRALSRRRGADRDDQRPDVGGLRRLAHPREGRDDRQQRSPFRRCGRRQRRGDPRARSTGRCGRSRRSTATTRIPPAASTRRPRTWRSGCGSSCRAGSSPTVRAVFGRDRTPVGHHRDADPDRAIRRRSWPALKANFHGYALGLDVRDYRGHKVVTHTGGLPGYVSRVAMIPDLNVGVAVLTNQESGAAFDSIAFRILDHYLGAPPFDWIDGYKRVQRASMPRRRKPKRRRARTLARRRVEAVAARSAKYAGTYRDAWYGDITIARRGRQARDAVLAHAAARRRPRALAARHVRRALARPRVAGGRVS